MIGQKQNITWGPKTIFLGPPVCFGAGAEAAFIRGRQHNTHMHTQKQHANKVGSRARIIETVWVG
jgi:hypothetical protein